MNTIILSASSHHTHGCTDVATFEWQDGETVATCTTVTNCHNCWQVGHDAGHLYFEVGDKMVVTELLAHPHREED